MKALVRNFWNDEQGQDLIEYTLLMAFVALASAALFIGAGGSVKGIWGAANDQLAAANTAENKTALKTQTEEAVARGLFGAPSFTVGGELFWGNDRLEDAIDWAKRQAA